MTRLGMSGFTLLELLVAIALTSVMTLGMAQLFSVTLALDSRLQEQSDYQERLHVAVSLVQRRIREAGYNPEPWSRDRSIPDPFRASVNGPGASSDGLSLLSWSNLNCHGFRNPQRDDDGQALFFIRKDEFSLTRQRQLAHSCWYGEDEENLVNQVRRQGRVSGVRDLQFLFGLDIDRDGQIDRWTDYEPGLSGIIKGIRTELKLDLGRRGNRSIQFHAAVRGRSG